MKSLRYTLVTDGSSDKALLPIIDWLLKEYRPNVPLAGVWADLARLPKPPNSLNKKIFDGLRLYPCDILFVHRDAENESRTQRVQEIKTAFEKAGDMLRQVDQEDCQPQFVCIIPVRKYLDICFLIFLLLYFNVLLDEQVEILMARYLCRKRGCYST